ncbi:hypothetical protein JL720_13903 [Aureococcus anophagefferens]|nr:hypothetical protein JL720_13903 [Aureococcus anophagefferens]
MPDAATIAKTTVETLTSDAEIVTAYGTGALTARVLIKAVAGKLGVTDAAQAKAFVKPTVKATLMDFIANYVPGPWDGPFVPWRRSTRPPPPYYARSTWASTGDRVKALEAHVLEDGARSDWDMVCDWLYELRYMNICIDDLMGSSLGRTVSGLEKVDEKVDDEPVAKRAKHLVRKWKKLAARAQASGGAAPVEVDVSLANYVRDFHDGGMATRKRQNAMLHIQMFARAKPSAYASNLEARVAHTDAIRATGVVDALLEFIHVVPALGGGTEALCEMARSCDDAETIVEAGGVQRVFEILCLPSYSAENYHANHQVLKLLMMIVMKSSKARAMICEESRFINVLIECLGYRSPCCYFAQSVLESLSEDSDTNAVAIIACELRAVAVVELGMFGCITCRGLPDRRLLAIAGERARREAVLVVAQLLRERAPSSLQRRVPWVLRRVIVSFVFCPNALASR